MYTMCDTYQAVDTSRVNVSGSMSFVDNYKYYSLCHRFCWFLRSSSCLSFTYLRNSHAISWARLRFLTGENKTTIGHTYCSADDWIVLYLSWWQSCLNIISSRLYFKFLDIYSLYVNAHISSQVSASSIQNPLLKVLFCWKVALSYFPQEEILNEQHTFLVFLPGIKK